MMTDPLKEAIDRLEAGVAQAPAPTVPAASSEPSVLSRIWDVAEHIPMPGGMPLGSLADAAMGALPALDWLDRMTIRHARQPFIESVRPSSMVTEGGELTPQGLGAATGGDPFGNPLGQMLGGRLVSREPSVREAELNNEYLRHVGRTGRPPGYMDRLDYQQETTPWYGELAAEIPFLAIPGPEVALGLRGASRALRSIPDNIVPPEALSLSMPGWKEARQVADLRAATSGQLQRLMETSAQIRQGEWDQFGRQVQRNYLSQQLPQDAPLFQRRLFDRGPVPFEEVPMLEGQAGGLPQLTMPEIPRASLYDAQGYPLQGSHTMFDMGDLGPRLSYRQPFEGAEALPSAQGTPGQLGLNLGFPEARAPMLEGQPAVDPGLIQGAVTPEVPLIERGPASGLYGPQGEMLPSAQPSFLDPTGFAAPETIQQPGLTVPTSAGRVAQATPEVPQMVEEVPQMVEEVPQPVEEGPPPVRDFDDRDPEIDEVVAEMEAAEAPPPEEIEVDVAPAQRGRPLPQTRSLPGKSTYARIPGREPYDFDVHLMDLDDPNLVISNDANSLEINPDFPPEFQPRDRTTDAMRADVMELRRNFDPDAYLEDYVSLEKGLSTVGLEPDGRLITESGNGRLIAIRGSELTYEKYRNSLDEWAGKYGFGHEDLAQFERPVLVRVRTTPLSPEERLEMVNIANESQTTALSETEQAAVDADKLSLDMIEDLVPEGTDMTLSQALDRALRVGTLQRFVQSLPRADQAKMSNDWGLSQYGEQRITSAIFQKAFGEDGGAVVRRFFQSTEPGMKRVQHGISREITRLVQMRRRILAEEVSEELDVTPPLARALTTLDRLQQEGGRKSMEARVSDYLAQKPMIASDEDVESDLFLTVMGRLGASSRPLADVLEAYTRRVLALPSANRPTLGGFDMPVELSRRQMLEEAIANAAGEVDVAEAATLASWRAAVAEVVPAEPAPGSYRAALLDDDAALGTPQLARDPEVVRALRGRNLRDPGVQEDPAVRDALNRAFARSTAAPQSGLQSNLGEEFATNQQTGMALAGDQGQFAPRGDEESLAAAVQRQEQIDAGQLEMEAAVDEAERSNLVDDLKETFKIRDVEAYYRQGQTDDAAEQGRLMEERAEYAADDAVAERLSDVIADPRRMGAFKYSNLPENPHDFEDLIDAFDAGADRTTQETLLRRYNGAVNAENNEINRLFTNARPFYERLGIQPGRFSEDLNDLMMKVLHDEASPAELSDEAQTFLNYVRGVVTSPVERGEIRFLQWVTQDESWTVERILKSIGQDPGRFTMRQRRLMMEALDLGTNIELRSPRETQLLNDTVGLVSRLVQQEGLNVGNRLQWTRPWTGPARFLGYDPDDMLYRMSRQPSYFPRRWVWLDGDPDTTQSARVRGRPSHTRERGHETYQEMRDLGYSPMYSDPLLTALYDRLNRKQFRRNVIILNELDKAGLAKKANEVDARTWSVPEVGDPFQGATFPNGGTAPSYAVPNEASDFFENLKGLRPSWTLDIPRLGQQDVVARMMQGTNLLKASKFTFSPFQLWDMFKRLTISHMSPRQPRMGWPIAKLPGSLKESMQLYFSRPSNRNRAMLAKLRDKESNFPEHANPEFRKINNAMYVDEGLGIGDRTVFFTQLRNEMPDIIERATEDLPVPVKWVNDARMFFQTGLFDVAYKNVMLEMMSNVEVPRQMARHPDWTARQVVAEAARVVNTIMSSPEPWQPLTIGGVRVSNPYVVQWARLPFISINEPRAWFGIALETLPIPKNTSYPSFLEYWAGMIIFYGLVGEVLSYAAIGKHLWQVPGMMQPFKRDEESPAGLSYSADFLRPMIPGVNGRGGRMLRLDLMEQADTPFRVLHPEQFLASRLSVPLRMLNNQWQGQTFYGEPLGNLKKRAIQAAIDMMPIPVEALLQAGRSEIDWLAENVPAGEERLGGVGNLIQGIVGLNLSSEPNRMLRDRFTRDLGIGESYGDLEPYQKKIVLRQIKDATDDELGRAAETAEMRGQEWGRYQAALRENEALQQERLDGLAEDIRRRPAQDVVRMYFDIEREFAARKAQLIEDFGVEFAERENPTPDEAALDGYYDLAEEAKDGAGNFQYADYQELRRRYLRRLTPGQRDYITRNTNLLELPPALLGFLGYRARNEYRRIVTSQRARAAHLQRSGLGRLLDNR